MKRVCVSSRPGGRLIGIVACKVPAGAAAPDREWDASRGPPGRSPSRAMQTFVRRGPGDRARRTGGQGLAAGCAHGMEARTRPGDAAHPCARRVSPAGCCVLRMRAPQRPKRYSAHTRGRCSGVQFRARADAGWVFGSPAMHRSRTRDGCSASAGRSCAISMRRRAPPVRSTRRRRTPGRYPRPGISSCSREARTWPGAVVAHARGGGRPAWWEEGASACDGPTGLLGGTRTRARWTDLPTGRNAHTRGAGRTAWREDDASLCCGATASPGGRRTRA